MLATARRPEQVGGLAVTRGAGQLVIRVGENVLEQVTLAPDRGDADCAYEVEFARGLWSVEGGSLPRVQGGALDALPVVNGLFSELALRPGVGPSIEVTTAVHATRTTTRQTIAWVVAALSAGAALFLAALERAPRAPWKRAARHARRAIGAAHPVDAVVGVVLVAFCVIAPASYDEGWVLSREQMFSSSGGFSTYYNALATNIPLGYWSEWAHHWAAQATSALVLLRLPMLACVGLTWLLCRWIIARVVGTSDPAGSTALWPLACAFLVGAFAWDITLRPEPLTALLVTGVAAAMLRFLERGTAAPVALVAVLVPLALTAHPAGIVSLAAVLVAAPRLLEWARRWPATASTIFTASCALLMLLAVVGSDLGQRRADTELTRDYLGRTRDEVVRYAALAFEPPLRRAAVGLLVLAALAFVLRRRRSREGMLDFPATVLLVGVVLLLATPSKWVWHFGAFVGIGAVAVATESLRLRSEGDRWAAWSSRPFVAVVAATLVGTWSWWTLTQPWSPVDLRSLDWGPGFAKGFPWELLGALPVLLLSAMLLLAALRGHRRRAHAVPWRVASWTAPLLVVPVLTFTALILVVDAAKFEGWTLARQNVEAFVGDPGCGLADDVLISVRSSARALPIERASRATPLPDWVPAAPVASLPRFVLAPSRQRTVSPWFRLPKDRRVGLFVAGTPAPGEHISLDWGILRRGRMTGRSSEELTGVRGELLQDAPWRFFAAGDLPSPVPGGTMVRVSYRTDTVSESAVAVTSPVTYRNASLGTEMRRARSRSLVFPDVLTYFPCTRLPILRDGAMEIPQHVVTTFDSSSTVLRWDPESPFLGLLDLYDLERAPVADTENWPRNILVFTIDRRIPGAKIAAPSKRTLLS